MQVQATIHVNMPHPCIGLFFWLKSQAKRGESFAHAIIYSMEHAISYAKRDLSTHGSTHLQATQPEDRKRIRQEIADSAVGQVALNLMLKRALVDSAR